MAEVQFSGIGVVDMNGSVGGTTFARNYYGAYAKVRIGAPAGSIFLTNWQTEVASLANVWEFGLSDSDRQQWYTVNRTAVDSMADRNVITGYDLFMSVNLNLFLVGGVQVMLPPVYFDVPQCGQPAINALSALNVKIYLSSLPDAVCAIYATKNLPAGRMSNNQIYAYIGWSFMSIGVIDIRAQYVPRLGIPITGKKIFFKVVPISQSSGFRGQPQYISGIVS